MTSFIAVCQAWSPSQLFYWITRRFLLESFVCLKKATDSCLWLPFCLFFLQHKTVLSIYQEVNSVSAMASTIKVLQRFDLAQVDTLYQLIGKLFARRTEDGVTQSRVVKVCLLHGNLSTIESSKSSCWRAWYHSNLRIGRHIDWLIIIGG